MRVTGDGHVQLQLRHRWADGTTHVVFDPLEFLGRLAVLVPRPRINLILYYGVQARCVAARHAARAPSLRPGVLSQPGCFIAPPRIVVTLQSPSYEASQRK